MGGVAAGGGAVKSGAATCAAGSGAVLTCGDVTSGDVASGDVASDDSGSGGDSALRTATRQHAHDAVFRNVWGQGAGSADWQCRPHRGAGAGASH